MAVVVGSRIFQFRGVLFRWYLLLDETSVFYETFCGFLDTFDAKTQIETIDKALFSANNLRDLSLEIMRHLFGDMNCRRFSCSWEMDNSLFS